MQNKQSIPPLIVKAGPEEDPEIIAAAAALGLTVASAMKQASEMGLTLRAFLGLEDAPVCEIALQYVRNGSLRGKRVYHHKCEICYVGTSNS